MANIYILLASFNRKTKTLKCLKTIMEQVLPGYAKRIVLFDDGSTDGTSQVVRDIYPDVNILYGDSGNYWCRSMCKAYASIEQYVEDQDLVLCLNDDVELYSSAISDMISQLNNLPKQYLNCISGRVENSVKIQTYGGLKRLGLIKYELEQNGMRLVDTMNFNVVLLPCSVIKACGFLDPNFEHSMGDIEFGLRVSKKHVRIYTSKKIVGVCESNDLQNVFKGANIRSRFQLCLTRKYFPLKSWLYFTKKTCGFLWPLCFIYPYFKFTFFP